MPKNNRHGQSSIFAPADYAKLRRAVKNRKHRLLLDIAWWTGERWGAIVQLQVEDVYENPLKSLPHEWITFRKQTRKASPEGKRSTRQVPVAAPLREILEAYKPPVQGWLFPARDEWRHMSFDNADSFLRAALERLGWTEKGFSTHSTRRSFITQLHENGVDVATIQELTGHQDIRTVRRYVDVSPARIKNAIALR
jgi:integrase/recombinase XerD